MNVDIMFSKGVVSSEEWTWCVCLPEEIGDITISRTPHDITAIIADTLTQSDLHR